MSEIKVNSIKGVGASAAAITVNNTDGTCTANITNRSNRNLVINGAMLVAQRGTSSTTEGVTTVDRIKTSRSGNDEAPTYAQVDVASGTTPYTLGFRKAFKVTNGNQTSGAGASDYSNINYQFESQDMATSGWNYTSSSSYITLSFWVKSSVAQNFYFSVFTRDGTTHQYTMETGSLTADTWTKITKTIPGNANVQFDTDTVANSIARGFDIQWMMFRGTNNTGTRPLNAWAAIDSAARSPDQTSTWYTTNDATFELTGVQLEVGSTATDFEHRSFADELRRCQRYYCKSYDYSVVPGTASDPGSIFGRNYADASRSQNHINVRFPVTMRTIPTTVNGYAPHSGTIATVSTDGSNPPSCGTEKNITAFNMLGENGFSGLGSQSIGSDDFFGLHFTADAEL